MPLRDDRSATRDAARHLGIERSMSVIRFPRRSGRLFENLIVAFVDLQNEYVSEGRPFAIGASAISCVRACTRLLMHARQEGLVVAHFRQQLRSPCFNPASDFFDWIDGCRPRASEAIYDRDLPSIYANRCFASYVSSIENPTIFLAGLSGETACLASAIDAHSRNHQLVFLQDCSASPDLEDLSAEAAHRAVTSIIGKFAEVSTSQEILTMITGPRSLPRRLAE